METGEFANVAATWFHGFGSKGQILALRKVWIRDHVCWTNLHYVSSNFLSTFTNDFLAGHFWAAAPIQNIVSGAEHWETTTLWKWPVTQELTVNNQDLKIVVSVATCLLFVQAELASPGLRKEASCTCFEDLWRSVVCFIISHFFRKSCHNRITIVNWMRVIVCGERMEAEITPGVCRKRPSAAGSCWMHQFDPTAAAFGRLHGHHAAWHAFFYWCFAWCFPDFFSPTPFGKHYPSWLNIFFGKASNYQLVFLWFDS